MDDVDAAGFAVDDEVGSTVAARLDLLEPQPERTSTVATASTTAGLTYDLRHSFASIADEYLAGNRKFVGKVMGHSNERTTGGYVHGVRHTISHAVDVWNGFLAESNKPKESDDEAC